ncbi:MAG: acetoacetyl-CoA reductase [Sphingomonas sp.]
MSIAQRVAIVTGGTSGIGAATAEAMKAQGLRVIATYSGDAARATAFEARTGIHVRRWSVADLGACREGVAEIETAFGEVDILVNNAGITHDASLVKMTQLQWQEVIDVDLTSCFNMAQAVFPGMCARKWGRIVNISSINGQAGQYGQTNYAAAKAGMIGFTKSLAQEGARHGVTVNAVAPGYTDTEMVRAVPADVLDKIIARIPVGRLATPAEIARCVTFLVAEDSAFITGSTLSVNGGQLMV